MKLHRQHIELLAGAIVKGLTDAKAAKFASEEGAELLVQNLISDDLMVEDKLNEEVREILSQHEGAMRSQGVQFHDMFKAVKQKLVRERKLIL